MRLNGLLALLAVPLCAAALFAPAPARAQATPPAAPEALSFDLSKYSCQDMLSDVGAGNAKRIGIAVIVAYVHVHDAAGDKTSYDLNEIQHVGQLVGGDCASGDKTRLLQAVVEQQVKGGAK
jgi:hypothetical protein